MANIINQREWDIFFEDQFQPLLPENAGIISFTESSDSTVPNAPIEDGSFSAYNKIPTPKRLSISVAHEGTVAERSLFEGTLAIAKDSLDLFWICSATHSWHNMTIESYSKSTASGDRHFLSIYDIEFVEVMLRRQTEAMTKQKQVKDPTTTKIQDNGKQQAKQKVDTSALLAKFTEQGGF